MKLPTLYSKSSKGKMGTWNISSVEDTIVTEWGEVGGKRQTSSVKSLPKNIGRSNETSASEQAALEAQSKWDKKRKQKYFLSEEEALGALNVKPMRAYAMDSKRKQRLKGKGPFGVQRKYDGVRCMAYLRDDGTVRLMSRGGEDYELPHIESQLTERIDPRQVLDGELYIHGELLQDIRHLIAEQSERVEFHVYDLTVLQAEDKTRWTLRNNALEEWFFDRPAFTSVKQVPTYFVSEVADAWKLHDEFVAEGYEGAMLRLIDGPYKMASKSTKLLKLKAFEDAEFRIVGHDISRDGVLLWICVQEEGLHFEVRPTGTMEYRASLLGKVDEYMGQLLTVKFKGRSADNKPLIGVGKGVRPSKDMD